MSNDISIFARWRAEQFTSGVDKSKRDLLSLGEAGRGVETALGRAGVSLSAIGGTAASVAAAVLGVNGIKDFLRRGFNESADEEAALRQLGTTARNLGLDLDDVSAEASRVATNIQRMAGIADDQAIAALRRMTQATGDYHQSVADLGLAADVAVGADLDMASAARAVAMAREGQIRGIAALIPSLRAEMEALEGTESAAVRVDMAMRTMHERFDGQAAASMDTMRGRVKSLGNAFGDLSQAIFEALHLDDAAKSTMSALTNLFNAGTDFINSSPTPGKVVGLNTKEALDRMARQRLGLPDSTGYPVPPGTFPDPTSGPMVGPQTWEDYYQQQLRGIPDVPNPFGGMPQPFPIPGAQDRAPIQPMTIRDLMGGSEDWWFDMHRDIEREAPKLSDAFGEVWKDVGGQLQAQLANAFAAGLGDGRSFAQALGGIFKQELGAVFSDLLLAFASNLVGQGGGFSPISIIGKVFGLGGASSDNLARRGAR